MYVSYICIYICIFYYNFAQTGIKLFFPVRPFTANQPLYTKIALLILQ